MQPRGHQCRLEHLGVAIGQDSGTHSGLMQSLQCGCHVYEWCKPLVFVEQRLDRVRLGRKLERAQGEDECVARHL